MNVVSFTADSTEHDFILTTNAIADVEELTGKSLGAITTGLSKGDINISAVRAMFYAGCRAGCRRVGRKAFPVDAEGAGDMIDALGLSEAIQVLTRGIQEAFPDSTSSAGEGEGSEDFSSGTKSNETAT